MKDFVVKQLERQLGFERGVDELLVQESQSREHFCQEQVELLADALSENFGSASLSAVNAMGETDKLIENSFTSRNVGWWQSEAEYVKSLYENIESQSTEDQEMLPAQDRASYFLHMQHLVNNVVRAFNLRRHQAECQGQRRLDTMKKHNVHRIQRHLGSVMANPRDDSFRVWGNERAVAAQHSAGLYNIPSSYTWQGFEMNDIDDPDAPLDQLDPMLSESDGDSSGTESLASLDTDLPSSRTSEASHEEDPASEADDRRGGPQPVSTEAAARGPGLARHPGPRP